jgi:DNA-binding transcriptional ArsR family regulator
VLERSAIEAVTAALASAGIPTLAAHGAAGLEIRTPGGETLELEVKAASRVDPMQARRYVEQTAGSGLLIVVADELTHAAQAELRDAGVGFLDRRGHLYLRDESLHLDLDVEPDPRSPPTGPTRDPIRGGAGITVASALLLHAGEPIGVRELSRRTGLPVSTTSKALAPIRDAALIDGGRALIPELFWALAEAWNPARVALAETPPEGTGVLSGTVAAAELGAPVAIAANSPPDLYVTDATEVRALERRFGTTSGQSRRASVAVQPTPLVTSTAVDQRAHVVFVALDLAQDRSRGREILDAWQPTEARRVW